MKNEIERSELPGGKAAKEIVGLEIIGKAQREEVAPFLVGSEKIGDHDLIHSPAIQFADEVASDKAGSAGNEDSGTRIRIHAAKDTDECSYSPIVFSSRQLSPRIFLPGDH